MGKKVSKEQQSVIQEDYQIQLNHPQLKNAVIEKTNKNHEYMNIHFPICNKKDYTDWSSKLKKSPGNDSKYTLHPNKHQIKTDSTCGKSGTAKIQYDNYSYTLKEQIFNRRKTGNKQFDETQIWYLIYGLADAASKFHQHKQKLGDIRPQNIFVNSSGKIKVSTIDSWPNETTNYQKYCFDHVPTLLAPEELSDIQIGRKAPASNLQTAQSFSIGMTALDSILLEDSENMYDKNFFNYDVFELKRANFIKSPRYSVMLKTMVNNLVSAQFGKRLTPTQVLQFLKPNQTNIQTFHCFGVNDLPYKLKRTAEEIQKFGLSGAINSYKAVSKMEKPQNWKQNYEIPASITFGQKYRKTLTQFDQKIAKSRQLF